MSPTERTLELLEKKYKYVGIVERFIHNNKIPHGIRSDLFNIIDIVCLSPTHIIGVQSCGTDYAAHYRKMTQQHKDKSTAWLRSGGRLFLIGWRKVKKSRGSKKYVTKARFKEITFDDLENAKTTDSKTQARKARSAMC